MDDISFHQQLVQFLRWGRHILKPLPEGNHRKSHIFQVLHHLRGIPTVVGDLDDVVLFSQPLDEPFNKSVMDHIPFRGENVSLPLPHIIKDMIPAAAQFQRFLRQPEERQNNVFLLFRPWRKDQHQRRNI